MFDLHEGADGRTDERTNVRTYEHTFDDVMAIKPNFLTSMGYQYFLRYGAPGACRAPLKLFVNSTVNAPVKVELG